MPVQGVFTVSIDTALTLAYSAVFGYDELVHMGRIVKDLPDQHERWSKFVSLVSEQLAVDSSITRMDCSATTASQLEKQ
jgi:hypothetical protein